VGPGFRGGIYQALGGGAKSTPMSQNKSKMLYENNKGYAIDT